MLTKNSIFKVKRAVWKRFKVRVCVKLLAFNCYARISLGQLNHSLYFLHCFGLIRPIIKRNNLFSFLFCIRLFNKIRLETNQAHRVFSALKNLSFNVLGPFYTSPYEPRINIAHIAYDIAKIEYKSLRVAFVRAPKTVSNLIAISVYSEVVECYVIGHYGLPKNVGLTFSVTPLSESTLL